MSDPAFTLKDIVVTATATAIVASLSNVLTQLLVDDRAFETSITIAFVRSFWQVWGLALLVFACWITKKLKLRERDEDAA